MKSKDFFIRRKECQLPFVGLGLCLYNDLFPYKGIKQALGKTIDKNGIGENSKEPSRYADD